LALTPVTVERFGGLNLRDDPFEIGASGAVATSDVALDQPGRVRTRDGYTAFATTSTAPAALHIYNDLDGFNQHIISSSSTKLEVFQQVDGSAVASGTVTPGVGPHAMTTYGSPALGSVVYATQQQETAVGIRKWSGSAWSVVAGTTAYVGRGIAFTRASNRLVIGGTNGGSRVVFSDAGAPEAFTSTSFVDLTPNDGQHINQLVAWQDYIFAFKTSKFFVFTGESTASTGTPIFNYRAVSGVGPVQGVGAVAVAPHGVYFIAQDGLYLTTGGPPARVDGPLAPLFATGSQALSFSTNSYIEWHRNRLIVVLGSSPTVYVYYPTTDAWAQWSMMSGKAGGGFRGYELADAQIPATSLLFVNGTNSAIYRMAPDQTTDNGNAIAWSYQSGKYPLTGDVGRVAIAPESSVVGSGTVTLALLSDLYASQSASVTLGTAPAVAEGWPSPIDQEGRWLQFTLSGTGAASVSELKHYVSYAKPAGVG
jgi:hypothetical protein